MKTIARKGFQTGFTVTEVVMVMVIVGILTAIGTPTFKYVTTSNRISGEVNALLGDMQFARTEAIKLGQTVSICSSSSSASYGSVASYGQCTQSLNWQNGWIVFIDVNGDKTVGAGDTILRTQNAFNGTDTFTAPTGYWGTTFNRMGYAPTGQTTTINIQLHNSTNIQNWTRCLAITPIGSASTEVYGVGTPVCN
jgi:type IV fimbrial biogenesis protein FimT